jgi:periplasmic protein CpxP/Spy
MSFVRWLPVFVFIVISTSGFTGCRSQTTAERADTAIKLFSWKIGLDESQRAKLEEVKIAYLKAHSAQKSEREKSFSEFRQMIGSQSLDQAKAKSLFVSRQAAIQADFDPVFAKVIEFHASLRDDQKQKIIKLMDEYSSRWLD